jgi:hypothetical protein
MMRIVERVPSSPMGGNVEPREASSFGGGIMESGAHDSHAHGPSSWSAARRLAEAVLVQRLERVTDIDDEELRRAVHAFVDVLVREGSTPEATVIALKETFGRAHFAHRFEPLAREQMRSVWVSECIERYFDVRGHDLAPRASGPAELQREIPRAEDGGTSATL